MIKRKQGTMEAAPFFEIYGPYTEVVVIVPQGYVTVPEFDLISAACFTQEDAHLVLLKLFQRGFVTPFQAYVLGAQINRSPLPKKLTPAIREELVRKTLCAITIMRFNTMIEGPLWILHDTNSTCEYPN